MLKKIPRIISPSLIKVLMEMGHGDQIVLADGNFPAASKTNRLISYEGHGIPEVLDALLELFPLDTYVKYPVKLMSVEPGDENNTPEVWDEYENILSKHEGYVVEIEKLDRNLFYDESEKAYAIIKTTETSLYGNIILTKGVIR